MRTDEQRKKLAAGRIRELRESLGLNKIEFAHFIGLPNGQSQVSRWEDGIGAPSAKNAALIAAKGNGDPSYYQGVASARQPQPDSPNARTIHVVGELEAGVWRESDEWDDDRRYNFSIPEWVGMPTYDMQAFIVRGASMDKVHPDGSVVFVANIFTNRIIPKDGDIVLVRRHRDSDGMTEASLKQLAISRDGTRWLWPRSSDPEFQAPLPLVGGNGERIEITGVVQSAFNKLSSFRVDASVEGKSREDIIIERHASGESGAQIARDFGISRERVRQIIDEYGGQSRTDQRKSRRAFLSRR